MTKSDLDIYDQIVIESDSDSDSYSGSSYDEEDASVETLVRRDTPQESHRKDMQQLMFWCLLVIIASICSGMIFYILRR